MLRRLASPSTDEHAEIDAGAAAQNLDRHGSFEKPTDSVARVAHRRGGHPQKGSYLPVVGLIDGEAKARSADQTHAPVGMMVVGLERHPAHRREPRQRRWPDRPFGSAE